MKPSKLDIQDRSDEVNFHVVSGATLKTLTPAGWHTVTPRLIAPDPERLTLFIKEVFQASGECRPGRPAELRIGDSIVMVSDGGNLREPSKSYLYVDVEDVDGTYQRALARNARSLEEPAEMPYGDRRATVQDEWGNVWQIAAPRDHSS